MPVQTGDVSADSEGNAMDEPGRWFSKAEAARELEISLSTLDRKVRAGEIEVVRDGHRTYVRMHGPEYLNDEDLLRHAFIRVDELEQQVLSLERTTWKLEQERDEARDAVFASEGTHRKLRRPMTRRSPRTTEPNEWPEPWA